SYSRAELHLPVLRPPKMALDIVRLIVGRGLVVRHTGVLMALDVLLGLQSLLLLEALLLRHGLPPSGRVRRMFTGRSLDGPAPQNLPYSSSNSQARMRSSLRAAIIGPAGRFREGFPGGVRQSGAPSGP